MIRENLPGLSLNCQSIKDYPNDQEIRNSYRTEREQKAGERTKDSQGKTKKGANFQGLLNFAIGSSLLITKAIMFLMPGKDHTHDLT